MKRDADGKVVEPDKDRVVRLDSDENDPNLKPLDTFVLEKYPSLKRVPVATLFDAISGILR